MTSKLYTLLYKQTMELLKTHERKVTIELPLTSIDTKYSLYGCYNYIVDKLQDKGYRTRLKEPNTLVIYTQKMASSIPYSSPATLGDAIQKTPTYLSSKEKASAEQLKKGQVSTKVKRQTEKIKKMFPNIDTVEYYRV